MAGLIWLDENHQWSVAGWVFDHVLQVSRPYVNKAGSSAILDLMDKAETGLNYISLEKLSPEEMKVFREALESAYQEMVTKGANSFGDPDFYPGFMKRFQELLEMIPKN